MQDLRVEAAADRRHCQLASGSSMQRLTVTSRSHCLHIDRCSSGGVVSWLGERVRWELACQRPLKPRSTSMRPLGLHSQPGYPPYLLEERYAKLVAAAAAERLCSSNTALGVTCQLQCPSCTGRPLTWLAPCTPRSAAPCSEEQRRYQYDSSPAGGASTRCTTCCHSFHMSGGTQGQRGPHRHQ